MSIKTTYINIASSLLVTASCAMTIYNGIQIRAENERRMVAIREKVSNYGRPSSKVLIRGSILIKGSGLVSDVDETDQTRYGQN